MNGSEKTSSKIESTFVNSKIRFIFWLTWLEGKIYKAVMHATGAYQQTQLLKHNDKNLMVL